MMFADERIIIKHLKNVIKRHPNCKENQKTKELTKNLEENINKKWRMYL